MEKSTLRPFLRSGLDILFVGLNPATGSSRNRHYFSVNQAFWNQLFLSGLITAEVRKEAADLTVFGSNLINAHGWQYGITDLVSTIAESDSTVMNPTDADCMRLVGEIAQFRPRAVILMHSKARVALARFLVMPNEVGEGLLGRWLNGVDSEFFAVPFPHGNAIRTEHKVKLYSDVAAYLRTSG